MTEVAQKRDEVKKQIKALLMSAPAALTIDELKRDYKDFMGENIPHRAMGYVLLEDFLKDMHNSIHVTWRKGVMCISAQLDENTAHIQRLVANQKVTNKNKWATLRKGGPPPQRHKSQPPRAPPHVPTFIRKNIIELLKAYPDGLPYTHFEIAFSRRFGIQINFSKLGFRTLKELLLSAPDILSVQDYGSGEIRVLPAHVGRSSRQNVSYSRSRSHDGYSNNYTHPPHDNTGSSIKGPLLPTPSRHKQAHPNLPPRLQQLEQPCAQQHMYHRSVSTQEDSHPPAEVYKPPHLRDVEANNQKENHTNVFQQGPAPRGRGKKRSCSGSNFEGERRRHESDVSSGSLDTSSYSSGTGMDHNSGISTVLIQEIQELLSSKPKGIWASRLPPEFEERYKKSLNVLDNGYTSVVQMCSALPDVIRIERPNAKGDWLLFDIRIPKEPEPISADQTSRQRHMSNERKSADPRLKEQIKQVLQCKPQGIPLHSLAEVFEELTGMQLPWAELGFKQVETFALSLADSILQFEYKGNDLILLYAIDNGEPKRTDLLKSVPLPEPKIQEHEFSLKIPKDAVGPNIQYSLITLPPCNEYIEVYISNIVSPGLFWFQLRGKNNSLALEKIMNYLDECYNSSDGNRYAVPDEWFAVGLVVAAIFPEDDNWHRCIITGLKTVDYVEVYFVDYGNTCPVHRKNIRLLKSKFLKLPGQAIQGRLSNIGPAGTSWTHESRNRLLKLVTNMALIALATAEKDCVMSLCLTDTMGKEDIHINDLLISEGYARFVPDEYNMQGTGRSEQEVVAPDYNCVQGSETASVMSETASSTPHYKTTPTAAAAENTTQPEAEASHSRHYVLQLRLTRHHVVHLINMDGTGYLLSSEISAFMWDADILTSMLRQRRGSANKIKVEQDCHPALFEELQQYGIQTLHGENNNVTLYEINSIPYILDLFGMDSEELTTSIAQLIHSFDPDDNYWKGDDFVESEAGSQHEESVEQFDVSDLQLTLQLLQFKRKRILQSMMADTVNTVDIVNELNNVEKEVTKLKEILEVLPREPENKTHKTQGKGVVEDVQEKLAKTENVPTATEPVNTQKTTKPIATVASTPIKTNVVAPMQSTNTSSESQSATQTTSSQSADSNVLDQNFINTWNQQQLLYQSMLMTQALNNASQPVQNTGQPANVVNPQMIGQQAPLINPLMPAGYSGLMPGLGNTNQMGQVPMMPSFGRGQGFPGNMMLLPGLLPLLNTLNIGSADSSENQKSTQSGNQSNPS